MCPAHGARLSRSPPVLPPFKMANKRYAILIASSRYPDEPGLTELRCPENDVDALNEVLSSPDFGQFSKTVVFKNAPSYEILRGIETVLADAGRDDLVLVYFSGHGKTNFFEQLYLATLDTNLKALGSTSIPLERLKSFFEHYYEVRSKILILDCCYSGAAGKAFAKGGGVDDQLQIMAKGQGTFIMTASTSTQIAVEKPGDSLGLFTKHLVNGIKSGDADRDEDGEIDIHELYQHVYEKVRAEGAQERMKWDINARGRMIIAKSGNALREQRRQEMERSLHRFAADGLLTSKIVQEAIRVLHVPKKTLTNKERQHIDLIAQLYGSKIGSADFIEQWMDLRCLDCAAAAKKTDNVEAKQEKVIISAEPAPIVPPPAPTQQKGRTIGQYIDHGDGTITDTKTGLMWKRCPEGLSGLNCENGKIEKYTWYDAIKRFKNVAYAGYSDWRMPTINELKTLVHCSKGKNKDGSCKDGSEKPAINQQAFPNAETGGYVVWSMSPDADLSGRAWSLYFDNGYSYVFDRFSNYAVRLVRYGR